MQPGSVPSPTKETPLGVSPNEDNFTRSGIRCYEVSTTCNLNVQVSGISHVKLM